MSNIHEKRLIDLTFGEFISSLDDRYLQARPPKEAYLEKEFLKVKGCAKLTGYSAGYIRQLVFKRQIPFMKLKNGSLRFCHKTIVEWMKSCQKIPLEETAQKYIENTKIKKNGSFNK